MTDLIDLLREAEWAGQTWGDACCPWCGGFQELNLPNQKAGHLADCRYVQAMREEGETEYTPEEVAEIEATHRAWVRARIKEELRAQSRSTTPDGHVKINAWLNKATNG